MIGERFKFLGVTDCEKWKEKNYLTWLIPKLKEAYPENNKMTSSSTPSERVSELKYYFARIDMFKSQSLANLVKKMTEIFLSPAAQALKKEELPQLITKIYENMTDKERVNHPANYLKECMKRIAPKTLNEFMDEYVRLYNEKQDRVLETQRILKGDEVDYSENKHSNYTKSKPNNQNSGSNGDKPYKIPKKGSKGQRQKKMRCNTQLCFSGGGPRG